MPPLVPPLVAFRPPLLARCPTSARCPGLRDSLRHQPPPELGRRTEPGPVRERACRKRNRVCRADPARRHDSLNAFEPGRYANSAWITRTDEESRHRTEVAAMASDAMATRRRRRSAGRHLCAPRGIPSRRSLIMETRRPFRVEQRDRARVDDVDPGWWIFDPGTAGPAPSPRRRPSRGRDSGRPGGSTEGTVRRRISPFGSEAKDDHCMPSLPGRGKRIFSSFASATISDQHSPEVELRAAVLAGRRRPHGGRVQTATCQ